MKAEETKKAHEDAQISQEAAQKAEEKQKQIAELIELLRKTYQNQQLADVLTAAADLTRLPPEKQHFLPEMTDDHIREILVIEYHKHTKDKPIKCIHCGHDKVHSKGLYRDKRRRYVCLKCRRTFNDLSNSVFGYIHKLRKMVQYLETNFFNGTAVAPTAEKLEVDHRTVFSWRHRIATALKQEVCNLPNEVASAFSVSEKIRPKCAHPSSLKQLGEIVSVKEFVREISLKGAHHVPGHTYDNPKVQVKQILDGRNFVNGLALFDDDGACSMQLMSFGLTISNREGERFLNECVHENKQVVVARNGRLRAIGKTLKRGKRRIVQQAESTALCDKWKNFQNVGEICQIAIYWGMKFRGVATKYQDNYYATICWFATHFRERNWLQDLLLRLTLNRGAVREYTNLRYLKIE